MKAVPAKRHRTEATPTAAALARELVIAGVNERLGWTDV
jgi:hypothetical protein